MKMRVITGFAAGVALLLAAQANAQLSATATLSDTGTAAPTPGPSDISQLTLTTDSSQPPGINYYFNNVPQPGETFTTSSNPGGYVMTSLTLPIGNDYGGIPGGGQAYVLRVYSVTGGTNAFLLATYSSQNNCIITPPDDWLQWSGLSLALAPKKQYAYTFAVAPGGSGYGLMGNSPGGLYAGGQAATIPAVGGTITFSSSSGYNAAFDIGLSAATSLTVNPPVATPANAVTNGTIVTWNALAAGSGSIGYQWRTDGGSGGTLTNIPSANGATLAVNTTSFALGTYQYAVVITNSSMTVTSAVSSLTVYEVGSATLTDVGTSVTPGLYDIDQLNGTGNNIGGGNADGLGYYDNAPSASGLAPGQTFTTGTNSQGYYLSSITVGTGGGAFSGVGDPLIYGVSIYSVQGGSNATLLASLTSGNFTFTYGDWLQLNGFNPLVLKPNGVYAYAFQVFPTNGNEYAGMACSPTNADLYPGGKICMIPTSGGPITFGVTGLADAAFDLGLLPVGNLTTPIPSPISTSPTGPQIPGTQITLSETAAGAAPLNYQWRTDGGSGGSLTNVPSATGTNLVLNTTGWQPGSYNYEVIVANSYGSATSSVATLVITYPTATVALTDIGGSAPAPLPAPDIAQTSWLWDGAYGNPPGLNYYINNVPVPGQTFTTGSNPGGYTLSTLALQTAGHGGYLPANGQPYLLRVYSVSGSNSTLYATFLSTNVAFTETDWLRWSGLALHLSANAQYAYSFGDNNPGNGYYEPIANSSGDLYTGGQTVDIPPAGGPMVLPTASGYDATFVLGFALAGYPIVSPAVIEPTNVTYAGSPVTLTAGVTGTGPFTYQWQTDGGTGGGLTNIPGATNLTQIVGTTGLDGLNVHYALKASNAAGATVGEAATLQVNAASGPILVSGADPASVATFGGGSLTLSASFTGTLPISYQWQVDTGTGPTNIVGQTNTTLVLNNLQAYNSGNYTLVASNSLNTATSTAASVTVYSQLADNTPQFTVNFQFRNDLGGDPGPYSGPGVSGYGSGTFWNEIYGPNFASNPNYSFTSASGLADDGATDMHFSCTVNSDNGLYSWPDGSGIALLGSPATAHGSTPQSFSFILPNGRYNVVLFSGAGSASGPPASTGATFTINGVTQQASPSTDQSFVQGNNYVVFTNVTVTGSVLNGTWEHLTGAPNFGAFNGAQLQYVGPAMPSLSLQNLGGGLIQLQWSSGTLLQSTNVTGPWITNNAASPLVVKPSATTPRMFYRVRIQ